MSRVSSSADLERNADRYDAINIKLDKCGGLTDALIIRDWCQRHDKKIMVGNMLGSSLAMAPALVVAQGADFVDLDGPLWQQADVEPPLCIRSGCIDPPPPGFVGLITPCLAAAGFDLSCPFLLGRSWCENGLNCARGALPRRPHFIAAGPTG